ncbi:MAG: sulfide/dihydroorotate dehydrogenase-like FAD/NAD-binding protein, partial [Acutalibacteraceae bacterium]
MFKILKKNILNKHVSHMVLDAPLAAKNAKPGQFVIIRVDEFGERIPLTVFKSDAQRGTVEIIYQKVGTTTYKLDEKQAGDYISDVVGPLG